MNRVKAEELIKLLAVDRKEYERLRYRAIRLPEAERTTIEIEASKALEKLRRMLNGE